MPLRILPAACLILFSSVFSAQDFTEELTRLISLTDANELRQAIDGYKRLASDSASPKWLKASSHYEAAELHARLRDSQAAVAELRQAVDLGFDDCQSPMKSEHLGPLLDKSDLRDTLRNIAIDEADYRELVWLQAEVNHAEHDARMMITENVNRVDQQDTVIPQSPVPSRATTSAGVLYWRAQLRVMQAAQRDFVRRSDEERKVHAATMQVAGSGANGAAVQESARQATARAGARTLDMQRRAFNPSGGANTVKPCSSEP